MCALKIIKYSYLFHFIYMFFVFLVFHKYNTVVCSTTFTKTLPFFSIMYCLCYWTEWVAGRDGKEGTQEKRKKEWRKKKKMLKKVECDKWDKSILFLLNEFNFLLLYFSLSLVTLCSFSLTLMFPPFTSHYSYHLPNNNNKWLEQKRWKKNKIKINPNSKVMKNRRKSRERIIIKEKTWKNNPPISQKHSHV